MAIEVRKLTSELLEDYMNFFDHVAFSDHKEWSCCYCVHFHWNDQMEEEYKEYEASGGNSFNRDHAVKFVKDGTIQGYVAYLDGTVVGWCNANNKLYYGGLAKEKWPEIWDEKADSTEKVKSAVCFTIAPDMRNKGIATALLNKVCQDAKTEGFDYVEAYPYKDNADQYANHHGPFALYNKLGFMMNKDLGSRVVVRKYL